MAHALAAVVLLLLALHASPARAFLTPGKTGGTELALLASGPGLWALTLETTGNADLGGQLGVQNADSFLANLALCDGVALLLCTSVDGADLDPESYADNVYLVVSVIAAGALNSGIGNPLTLGWIDDTGVLPRFTLEGLLCLPGGGPCPTTGLPEPVTFVNAIPEPNALALLALALASIVVFRDPRERDRARTSPRFD